MKLDDAFNGIRDDLMDPATHGRVHGILLNSTHQTSNLAAAFERAGLAFRSTKNVQINNAVPGFVTMADEQLSLALYHALRSMDCDVARMTLNADANTSTDVIKTKFVSGGPGYAPHR